MENIPQNPQQIAPQKTNSLAVASFVLALLGLILWPLTTIPAIICGHKARANFRKGRETNGDAMALAGIIIGYVLTVVFLVNLTLMIVFFVFIKPHQILIIPGSPGPAQLSNSHQIAFRPASLASNPHLQLQKGTEAYRGAMVFQTRGCISCHMIAGNGGTRGQDLTNIADRETPKQMTVRIIHGGTNMPAFGPILKPGETKALIAFLSTLHHPKK